MKKKDKLNTEDLLRLTPANIDYSIEDRYWFNFEHMIAGADDLPGIYYMCWIDDKMHWKSATMTDWRHYNDMQSEIDRAYIDWLTTKAIEEEILSE